MITIYRYELSAAMVQELEIPATHKILHCTLYDGKCNLWAWVDSDSPIIIKKVAIILDRQPAPDFNDSEYLCTFFAARHAYHVFVEKAIQYKKEEKEKEKEAT